MIPSRSFRYRVVDVFTSTPLEGNPLAVFPDSAGLSPDLMQKIAREFNLSETVFVSPSSRSDCAARLRIFTPGKEMDFAGHPTVGTAWVLLNEGIVPNHASQFAVEENVGPVAISVDSGLGARIWLTTPEIRDLAAVQSETAAALLGLTAGQLLAAPPQILSAGNPTLFIPVPDRETVDRVSLDSAAWSSFRSQHSHPMCVFIFAPTPEGAYSRMFAPDYGVSEDPATGSSTGPLAFYMLRHGLAPAEDGTSFYSEQGTKMGRRSILHVRIRGEHGSQRIEVGGHVTPILEGTLTF